MSPCEILGCSGRATNTMEEEVTKIRAFFSVLHQRQIVKKENTVKAGTKLCTRHFKKYEKERRKKGAS